MSSSPHLADEGYARSRSVTSLGRRGVRGSATTVHGACVGIVGAERAHGMAKRSARSVGARSRFGRVFGSAAATTSAAAGDRA